MKWLQTVILLILNISSLYYGTKWLFYEVYCIRMFKAIRFSANVTTDKFHDHLAFYEYFIDLKTCTPYQNNQDWHTVKRYNIFIPICPFLYGDIKLYPGPSDFNDIQTDTHTSLDRSYNVFNKRGLHFIHLKHLPHTLCHITQDRKYVQSDWIQTRDPQNYTFWMSCLATWHFPLPHTKTKVPIPPTT
jgi:hypothetical protein